ncbi:hypothetical protein [Rhodococcus opacus]|uniref:hypothetical protein n=1 Tax=Rhodococcus opacus TaxID=37919 RepID=UPI000A5B56FA|nr:hypothetical protein [Rhodococcus opacus]
MHAFVDENTVRGIMVAAAIADPRSLAHARKVLTELRLKGQERLHFKSERDSRRREICNQYALNVALRQLCWQKHEGYESEEEIRIAVMNPASDTRHERPSAYGPRTVEYVELVNGDPTDHDATLIAATETVFALPILAVRIGPRNTPTKLTEDLNETARLLDENGYNVPVVASTTPFLRGR